MKSCNARAYFGLWQIGQRVIDTRLEEVHLGENHLVVEPLQFLQQRVDQAERLLVVLVVDITIWWAAHH